MPDLTVPKKLIETSDYGQVWACYFSRSIKGSDFAEDEVQQLVSVARTAMISHMVKEINAGRFLFPRGFTETQLLISHLKKLRKVRRVSETTGERVEAWVSTDSEDHYAFALLYAYTALKMMEAGKLGEMIISPSQMVTKVKTRGYDNG